MNARCAVMMLLLPMLAAAGCVDYTAPERYENGLILVFDGAGGITLAPHHIRQGLDEGGVKHAMEVFDWTGSHDVIDDQQNIERNRQVAGQVAERIQCYQAEHPDCPVHMVGLSAGTGIVIFALEQLPPGKEIDGVCLLASSVNENYDLTQALTRVRNEITNFSSVNDLVILGLGVGLAGTVDRGQGTAAGLGGFKVPPNASPTTCQLYKEKLVDVPWNPLYVFLGHLGDHLGATNPAFVKHFMAPILLDAQRRRGGLKAPEEPEADDSPTTSACGQGDV